MPSSRPRAPSVWKVERYAFSTRWKDGEAPRSLRRPGPAAPGSTRARPRPRRRAPPARRAGRTGSRDRAGKAARNGARRRGSRPGTGCRAASPRSAGATERRAAVDLTCRRPARWCRTYWSEFASAMAGTAPSSGRRSSSSHGFARSASVAASDAAKAKPSLAHEDAGTPSRRGRCGRYRLRQLASSPGSRRKRVNATPGAPPSAGRAPRARPAIPGRAAAAARTPRRARSRRRPPRGLPSPAARSCGRRPPRPPRTCRTRSGRPRAAAAGTPGRVAQPERGDGRGRRGPRAREAVPDERQPHRRAGRSRGAEKNAPAAGRAPRIDAHDERRGQQEAGAPRPRAASARGRAGGCSAPPASSARGLAWRSARRASRMLRAAATTALAAPTPSAPGDRARRSVRSPTASTQTVRSPSSTSQAKSTAPTTPEGARDRERQPLGHQQAPHARWREAEREQEADLARALLDAQPEEEPASRSAATSRNALKARKYSPKSAAPRGRERLRAHGQRRCTPAGRAARAGRARRPRVPRLREVERRRPRPYVRTRRRAGASTSSSARRRAAGTPWASSGAPPSSARPAAGRARGRPGTAGPSPRMGASVMPGYSGERSRSPRRPQRHDRLDRHRRAAVSRPSSSDQTKYVYLLGLRQTRAAHESARAGPDPEPGPGAPARRRRSASEARRRAARTSRPARDERVGHRPVPARSSFARYVSTRRVEARRRGLRSPRGHARQKPGRALDRERVLRRDRTHPDAELPSVSAARTARRPPPAPRRQQHVGARRPGQGALQRRQRHEHRPHRLLRRASENSPIASAASTGPRVTRSVRARSSRGPNSEAAGTPAAARGAAAASRRRPRPSSSASAGDERACRLWRRDAGTPWNAQKRSSTP